MIVIIYHLIAIIGAYLIDRVIGDPISLPHPVRMIGALISKLERRWNRGKHVKIKGMLFLAIILLIVTVSALCITYLAYTVHPIVGIIVEAGLIATTIATKGLAQAAQAVYESLSKHDLHRAREKVSEIVGRDTDELDEADITRATIETVAENTSDSVTAPLFWALIGGAPFALMYRAVNTCDSMVGYKTTRFHAFGWAAAKVDDLLNYIPSRLTGMLMILANKPYELQSRIACYHILFRDAKQHASPNSGWGEAAMAALLGVQLGGKNTYNGIVSESPIIGEKRSSLRSYHILQANKAMHRTVKGMVSFYLFIGGGLYVITRTWL